METQLWAIVGASGLLMVRAGLALHETGMLRARNSVSGIVRNIAGVAIAALAFWAIGAAVFAFSPSFLFAGFGAGGAGSFLLLLATVLLGAGITSGSVAERSRLGVVYTLSIVLAALLIPLCGYFAKGSFLVGWGFRDLGGASFVHMAGGLAAAVGAIYIGPRMGKYNRDGSANGIPGHSVPLTSVGALLMLVGWPAYLAAWNPALAANAATNVILATAAGAVGSLIFSHMRYGKPDVHLLVGGLIGGLVAITAGADLLAGWAAVLTGLVAGLLVPAATLMLDLMARIDDPTSSISMHALAGAWGVLAAGLFRPADSFLDKLGQIGVHLLGIVLIAALALVITTATLAVLCRFTRLRAREADEFDGLDLAEHDIGAYPDFQQTTIKSYHLREA